MFSSFLAVKMSAEDEKVAYSRLHGNTVDRFFGFDARLRLYQRRFLRPRRHFSAFFKLQFFAFAPFQISVIFQSLRTARRKNRRPFYRVAESSRSHFQAAVRALGLGLGLGEPGGVA